MLRYAGHEVSRNRFGARVEVRQRWKGLTAVSHFQFYDGVCAVRSWTELTSAETETVHPVEYLSSFRLTGLLRDGALFCGHNRLLHIPHHTWYAEAQWQTETLTAQGASPIFEQAGDHFSMKRAALSPLVL